MAQESVNTTSAPVVHVDSSALFDTLLEGRGSHDPGLRRGAHPEANSNSAVSRAISVDAGPSSSSRDEVQLHISSSEHSQRSSRDDGLHNALVEDISRAGHKDEAVANQLASPGIDTEGSSAPSVDQPAVSQDLLVPIAGHEVPALTVDPSKAGQDSPAVPAVPAAAMAPETEKLSSNPVVAALQRQRSAEMTAARASPALSVVLTPELAADSRSVSGAQLSAGQRVLPSHFDLLKVIGRGAYGKVLLARHKGTRKVYAMKVFDKDYLVQKGQVSYTHVERNIMAAVRHPFLVQLRFALQTTDSLYLVMDFLAGGDLVTHLQRQGILTEDAARVYAAEMVLALEHLHSLGIVHRDLKPENVLLGTDGHVRLTDYGLAKVLGTGEDGRTRTLCGTTEYMAPEMVAKPEGGYTSAVDWWSLGALLYEMLTGRPPFEGKDVKKLYKKILTAPLTFPRHLSPKVQSLLKGLMDRDPQSRLGARRTTRFVTGGVPALKQHVFFKKIDWAALVALQVAPPIPIEVSQDNDVAYFDDLFTSQPLMDDTSTGRVAVGNGGDAAAAASSTRRGATVHSSHNEAPPDGAHQAVPGRRFRGFSFVHPDIAEEYEGVYDFSEGGVDDGESSPSSCGPTTGADADTGTTPQWLQSYDAMRAVELKAEEEAAAAAAAAAALEAEQEAERKAKAAAERAKNKKQKKKKGGRKTLADSMDSCASPVSSVASVRPGKHTAAGRPVIRDAPVPVGLSGGSRRVSNTSLDDSKSRATSFKQTSQLTQQAQAVQPPPALVPVTPPKEYKPSGMWAALAAGKTKAPAAAEPPKTAATAADAAPVVPSSSPAPPVSWSLRGGGRAGGLAAAVAPTAPPQAPLLGGGPSFIRPALTPSSASWGGTSAAPAPSANRWAALASQPLGAADAGTVPTLPARKQGGKSKWKRVAAPSDGQWR